VEFDTTIKGYTGGPTFGPIMGRAPTVAPTITPVEEDIEAVPLKPNLASNKVNSSQNSTTSIIMAGIGFGAGLLVTLLFLGICLIFKRRNRKMNAEKQQPEAIKEEDVNVEMKAPKVSLI